MDTKKWELLKSQRQELLDLIQSKRTTLRENDVDPEDFDYVYANEKARNDAMNPFYHNTQWTPLGRLKLAQLFNKFDTNRNGILQFAEFRQYLCFFKRIQHIDLSSAIHNLESNEAFLMYIHDCYQAKVHDGMTLSAFEAYRLETEDRFPLVKDLLTAGYTWLDPEIEFQTRCRRIFQQYDIENNGFIKPEQLQYVAYECGLLQTQEQIQTTWSTVQAKQSALLHVRRIRRAKRLFGNHQVSSLDTLHDGIRVCRAAFLAWMYADIPISDLLSFQRLWLQATLGLFTFVRKSLSAIRVGMHWIRQVNAFGLFSEQVFDTTDASQGHVNCQVAVKKSQNYPGCLQIIYANDGDARTTLDSMGYNDEPEAQGFVFIDFLCHENVSEMQMGQTITILQRLLDRNFQPLLNILPQFQSWTVVAPPQSHSNGVPVVRIVLYFGEDADPYLIFSQLGLPIQLDQLIERFRLRLQLSHSLVEMLDDKRMILNDVGLHASISAHLNRTAIAKIIEEAARQCLMEVDEGKIEREMLAQTKTVDLNPDNQSKDWAEIDFERHEARRRDVCETWLKIARWIRYTENVQSTLALDSLRDLLTDSAFIHQYFPKHILELLLDSLDAPGIVKGWWSNFIQAIESDMKDIASDFPESGELNCDQELIAAYSVLRKTFLGLYSIRAEAGTCSLTLRLDGFDIFEVLPDLTPQDQSEQDLF